MKKLLSVLTLSIMIFSFCSCGSDPNKTIAINFVNAIAEKDYEKASNYSWSNSDILKSLYSEKDLSGFKFKQETTVDKDFLSYVFESKDGKKYQCVLTSRDEGVTKECGASGFID